MVLILSVYSVVLTYIIILGQMEVPSWLLQSTSYAIMTAILTGILVPSVLDYFKNRKLAKNKKKKELEKELNNVRQIASVLQRSLKERVKNNSFPNFSDVEWFHAPSDLKEKGEKYDGMYDLCVDLKEACKSEIIVRLQELTKEHLPETSKEHDLVNLLNNEDLTNLYMSGVEVTKRWIEKEYPRGLYEDIMKNLKDKETRLDHFFKRLNLTFLEDPVLERFRKEKANLIELGNKISNDLTHKEEELKKELEKFT